MRAADCTAIRASDLSSDLLRLQTAYEQTVRRGIYVGELTWNGTGNTVPVDYFDGLTGLRAIGTGAALRVNALRAGELLEGITPGANTVAINGAPRTVPLGFESEAQFLTASRELQAALRSSGIDDAVVGVRGSLVLGHSPRKGTTLGPQSDIDFFVESAKLTEGYSTSKNIPGFVIPKKILPDYPALKNWSEVWSSTLKRDVTPGAFVPGTVPSEAAILVK
jgi:hypothetical protein